MGRGEARKFPEKKPVVDAQNLEELVRSYQCPKSKRGYVSGYGACVGLTATGFGDKMTIAVHNQKLEVIEIVRRINAAIGAWCEKHAPKGYDWTTLQINVDTVSDWHRDHRNLRPSCLMLLGTYTGGEIEVAGFEAAQLQDEAAMLNGYEWH